MDVRARALARRGGWANAHSAIEPVFALAAIWRPPRIIAASTSWVCSFAFTRSSLHQGGG